MLRKIFIGSAITLLSCFSLSAEASKGEALETQMWEDMKHHNWSGVENNIADSFQAVHSFGTNNRAEELDLIKKLYLGSYKISDIKTTENDDTIIVTYLIAVSETIDDKRLSARPAPRLSVWKKIDGKWKWIAHANLNPVDEQAKKVK